tara:strand:+ start:32 stop:790 length:759 start_codon:yes stop_codon:yes gene_type:complete
MKEIAIFIPERNVGNALINTIERIPIKIRSEVGQILVIDNASSDDTYQIALDYKEKSNMKNLKIIKNEKNLGYGGSQKKAYDYAIREDFNIIVMLHGDAQYSPEHIQDIIKPLQDNEADFVFGSRITGDPLKGGMPKWRFIGNRVLTALQNLVLNLDLSEYHSGYRAFKISALKQMPFQKLSNNYHFDNEIFILFAIAKMRIKEVTIPTFYGNKAHSPSIYQTFKYACDIIIDLTKFVFHKTGIKKIRKFEL